jgi:hypothetical protein
MVTMASAALALGVGLAAVDASAMEGPCAKGRKTETSKLHDGISMIEESCEDPLYHAFVVTVDLDQGGYRFFVTPYENRRRTTSAFVEKYDALLAINGGFWGGEWGGFTVGEGELWKKDDFDTSTVVGFGPRGDDGRLRVDFRPTEEMLTKPLPWMQQALTGIPMLIEGGKIVDVEVDHTLFKHKHPRTAMGMTKDGSTVLLVVVDGRQPDWSLGLKTEQLAQLLGSHGAHTAVNLDGGSSSTLVVPKLGGLVNDPCYKKADERQVPNHLGIVEVSTKTTKKAALSWLLDPLSKLFG